MKKSKITRKAICITADINDGDFISQLTFIEDKDLTNFLPLISKIKENDGLFGTSDFAEEPFTETYAEFPFRLLDAFSELVPYGEYGVHRIEKIDVLEVTGLESFI